MSKHPGEVGAAEQRRMIRFLKQFLLPVEARAAIARISQDSRARSLEWIVAAAESEGTPARSLKLPDEDLIQLLVELAGVDLLADRDLRRVIADHAGPVRLEKLHEYQSSIRGRRTHRSRVDAVAQRKWQPGRSWANHFVRTLGLPGVYAGWRSEGAPPDTVVVEPCVKLPPLRDFQDELRSRVLDILSDPKLGNRAILTLPTGAGKTRTSVEAVLSWRLNIPGNPVILWIAQSEELCEQAVQSFKEVWFDLGHRAARPREALTIGRLWGDRNAAPTECGVIVASIQKLHAAVRGDGSGLTSEDVEILGGNVGVVIVDEAHRALAPSYGQVLRHLGVNFRLKNNTTALLGLTATPRRAGEAETARLHRRFRNRILGAPSLGADPVQSLRSQGILARVRYEGLEYDAQPIELAANASHAQYFENFEDIHTDVLRRLGEEHTRNRLVLDRILDLDPSWPVLLFACSTQHAQAMASLLRRRGRTAGCVLANTRPATRRALVERFRDGELSVLCNYGVLTTGFDAPSVRCVVVARPTASAVLYEQMIGRGMRGPAFGGTDLCLILDLKDNVQWRSKPVTVDYVSLENDMRQGA